jgi:hypothetical protein
MQQILTRKIPRTGVKRRKGDCKLLRAKLHAPTINKNISSREKLPAKLQHAKEGRLALVMAPAGYGKTTAVLDWLGKCGLPFAWLSLSESDNHPITFWEYIRPPWMVLPKAYQKKRNMCFVLRR